MRLKELAGIVNGERRGGDREFATVSIDTRTLADGDLFFALTGPRFDGHEFVAAAAQKRASAAVVERWVDVDLPQIKVESARLALGRLGQAWRQKHTARVVGLTGSNGKTTVKEMIAAILAVDTSVLSTRGNLNNDLGVPLTLMGLRPEHAFAVIEMGANHHGEIAYVTALARPDVVLITNAGDAHLEGFGSREGVARGKGEIIEGLEPEGIAILNADDAYYPYWREKAGQHRVLSFGFSPQADLRAIVDSVSLGSGAEGFETRFMCEQDGSRHALCLRLAGRHNIANALAAAAAARALGIGFEQIAEGLAGLTPVPGRMQPTRAANGALLINDTYNANPSSFAAALDVLLELPGEPWFVLGAFGELGEDSPRLHAELGELARIRGVRQLFATGNDARFAVQAFGAGACFFSDQDALIQHLLHSLHPDAVVLVKGSRAQRMERVLQALCAGHESTSCC